MSFEYKAKAFIHELPYQNPPYNSRNWGNSWHSLCSYHGKLKPSIAHFLISYFTDESDIILDPLCGVGTIPFEACLQGRIGIGNDLSEMAYVVSKAKLEATDYKEVQKIIQELKTYLSENIQNFTGSEYLDFGFNGNLPEYFDNKTYKEILCARCFFLDRLPTISASEAMVFSALLHVLHGNRPYALSRRSHPLTPYAPTGEFVYKDVIEKIEHKININYKNQKPNSFRLGRAIHGDYSELSQKGLQVDAIICSPPFADSIRFYMNNWMRLWMCGWEPAKYKEAENIFLDSKQKHNFDVYSSFFQMCSDVLKPNGKVILHLGKTKKYDMGIELSSRASKWFDMIYMANESVEELEKHGIKDKGGTIAHQFLFLQKK